MADAMIIRIGKHEVTLVPAESGFLDEYHVGEVEGIPINCFKGRFGWCAYVCAPSNDGSGTFGTGTALDPQRAFNDALIQFVARCATDAGIALRAFEQLDVHALNVAARMRETAEVAERARRLIDG